jgi:large subunit ribosomal protein L9
MAKPSVELLLIENVDNLGIVGDIVTVKPGYARNYLLPMGLATQPSEGAKKAVAERRAEVERQLAEQRKQQERMIEKLEGFEITLERSANEQGVLFGSVTQHDIAEALDAAGFPVPERAVRIGEQLKRLGNYNIPVKLADDLETEIKLWIVSDQPVAEDALPEEERTEDIDEGVEGSPDTLADYRDNVPLQEESQ